MITAFCANPCIDRTVEIETFTYGGMNRIQHVQEDGSGKGVNVALVCRALGLEAAAVGVCPWQRSELVRQRLEQADCQCAFIYNDGAVRVNTKVLDRSKGVITELNEKGVPSAADEVEKAIALAVEWAARSDFLVLTGSLPAGMPTDLYAQIARRAAQEAPNCRVVLDAEGKLLEEGLAAKPFMVKPNNYELELLCGRKLEGLAQVHAAAQEIIARGVPVVAVSLGGDGAYITNGQEAYFAPVMKVEVRSTVGAGDSMVAGLLSGFAQGMGLEACFRLGVAAATSSVTTEGTRLVDVEKFREFIPQVQIQKVE
ncbi:MAG: 1-phosphofructokinase family hexose kinase [Eubacteriales bacterium]|nr:1-phosphofructokinase family hexose kinase [Eubacteriales bacterium]